jgi:hypothetical protein
MTKTILLATVVLSMVPAVLHAQCKSDAAGALISASGLLALDTSVQTAAFPPGSAKALLDTATLPIPLPLPLQIQVLDVAASDCASTSKVAHVSLDLVGLLAVTADVAEATASLDGGCQADAHVANLNVVVAGVPLALPDVIPANLVVPLGPLGSLVVNEESCSANAADATVLHLNLLIGLPPLGESVEILVAHASAEVSRPSVTVASRRSTGGGLNITKTLRSLLRR